jgi:hypothetical protein
VDVYLQSFLNYGTRHGGRFSVTHGHITFREQHPLSVADNARYTYPKVNVNARRQEFQLALVITPWFSHWSSLQPNHYSDRATWLSVSHLYTSGSLLTMWTSHWETPLSPFVMSRWQQCLCWVSTLPPVSACHAAVPAAHASHAKPSWCTWKPGIWRVLAERSGSQTHTIPLQTNKQTNKQITKGTTTCH